MAELLKIGTELNGWKEISAHLGVGVRTAQKLENEHHLPVHRWPGSKARVYAFQAELAAWKKNVDSALLAQDTRNASDEEERPTAAQPGKVLHSVDVPFSIQPAAEIESLAAVKGWPVGRREWLRYAATVTGGLGVGVAAVKMSGLFQGQQPPTAYRVEGATLIVFGRKGSELWRYTFPKQMLEEAYKNHPEKFCRFSDLGGAGRIATLFRYCPADPGANQGFLCFDSNGQIRWKFEPGREVVDNIGRRFTGPYYVSSFAAVRSPNMNRSHVVVSSAHNWSFPAQIAVLDGITGNLVSEYWHRGHLTELAVAELDHDGHPKILLGGVNDASDYKCATLVMFDHRWVSGATRDPLGQPYFRNMPPGTEKWTLFFPKTPISEREEFNRVNYLLVTADRIRVNVSEGIFTENPVQVVYEFDYNLRPINAVLSGELLAEYKKLQTAGELPVESPYVTADRLIHQIKVIKGS